MQPCQGEAVCFYAKALYSAFPKVDAVRNQIISEIDLQQYSTTSMFEFVEAFYGRPFHEPRRGGKSDF